MESKDHPNASNTSIEPRNDIQSEMDDSEVVFGRIDDDANLEPIASVKEAEGSRECFAIQGRDANITSRSHSRSKKQKLDEVS